MEEHIRIQTNIIIEFFCNSVSEINTAKLPSQQITAKPLFPLKKICKAWTCIYRAYHVSEWLFPKHSNSGFIKLSSFMISNFSSWALCDSEVESLLQIISWILQNIINMLHFCWWKFSANSNETLQHGLLSKKG